MPRADKGKTRFGDLTPAHVAKLMHPGERMTVDEVARRVGVSKYAAYRLLVAGCEGGVFQRAPIDFNLTPRAGFLYWLADAPRLPVSAPYPPVLLGPDVPDAAAQIGAQLRVHMNLCMRTK